MSKEGPKIDLELTREFDKLIEAEGRKLELENRLRNALWALDTLKSEKLIGPKTTLEELINIIEERKKELRQSSAYAENTALGAKGELHDIAFGESKTAKRLLVYMEAVLALLMLHKLRGYNTEDPIGKFEDSLKKELEKMEADMDKREDGR